MFGKMNNLQKLQDIVSSLPLMAYIATKCDARYNEVTGSPYHDPENFRPPYDERKARAVSSNVLAVFAVIGQLQHQAILKGARDRRDVNDAILDELDGILDTPDFRQVLPAHILNMMPLNIEQAIHLFGAEKIGYLIAANATWNAYQWSRTDKGILGAHGRSNIFAELSLAVLMLDWDQVLVIARELRELLTEDNLARKTTELQALQADNGNS